VPVPAHRAVPRAGPVKAALLAIYIFNLETFAIIKHGTIGFVETEALARVSTIWRYTEGEDADMDS
jgi:hypothetical protein